MSGTLLALAEPGPGCGLAGKCCGLHTAGLVCWESEHVSGCLLGPALGFGIR